MQRWIVAGVVLVVVSIMLVIGAYFGYRAYKQNQMIGIWLPLPVEQASVEQRAELAAELKQRLANREMMVNIAKESGFTKDFGFASDGEAATNLLERFFSRQGTFKTPEGRSVPVVEVGFSCKVKEFQRMGKVTTQLSKEIQAMKDSAVQSRDDKSRGIF